MGNMTDTAARCRRAPLFMLSPVGRRRIFSPHRSAKATTAAVYLARTGHTRSEIGAYIRENYYPLKETLAQIRPAYRFHSSCQGTVPQAIQAYLESTSFEDAIRNAISLGGDSDTLAAITGGIAEAYYGIPHSMCQEIRRAIEDSCLLEEKDIISGFRRRYANKD